MSFVVTQGGRVRNSQTLAIDDLILHFHDLSSHKVTLNAFGGRHVMNSREENCAYTF